MLPLGEFTVMILEPHAKLQGAVTWRNQCHDRATLRGVIIPSAILKIVFRHILFFLAFNAVWALTSGSFRIVSDTLVVYMELEGSNNRYGQDTFEMYWRKLLGTSWRERRANKTQLQWSC